jgi:hypothetical protein
MRNFLIAIITLPHPEQRAKRAFVEGRAPPELQGGAASATMAEA